jgi:integrase
MELALVAQTSRLPNAVQDSELSPAILRLLEGVERSLTSENSRRAYRTSLFHFFTWCSSSRGDGTLSRLSVLQYKDGLIGARKELESGDWERQYSPATVNLRLAAVRAFAQEAADAGLVSQNEVAAIRRVRGEKQSGSKIGNWLQKHQVDAVLKSVNRTSLRGKRDYAILAVLFATALRRRELVELQVATIQERDSQWGLIGLRGKGGKVRNISLPEWVRLAIMDWLVATQIVQGSVFRSISRHGKLGCRQMSEESVKLILSHYTRLRGHDNFRPHDARRTCARLCRSGNAAIEDVQELLGHSSIQTTERYLGKTEGFKRAITNLIVAPTV